MLIGGIEGYPDAIIVVEDVMLSPVTDEQSMLSGTPKVYDYEGGSVIMVLPFDPTAVTTGTDGVETIESAMQAWVAFRHMTRV